MLYESAQYEPTFLWGKIECCLYRAILGDQVEIGCGAVLNPGTVIGRQSTVYPLSSVRGTVGPGSIYKKAGDIAGKAVPLI